MSLFFRISIAIVFFFGSGYAFSQQLLSKRTTLYTVVGTSGAKLNQFDQMLEDRGLTGLRNRYGDYTRVYPIARGTGPVVVTIILLLFFGVKLSTYELLGIIIISVGIISISTQDRHSFFPWITRKNTKAIIFALLTGLFIGGYSIVDGYGARASFSPLSFMGWSFIVNALLFPILLKIMNKPDVVKRVFSEAKLLFWFGGTISYIVYGIVVWGFTLAPIPLVSALRETSVIIALLIGTLFLKERFTILKALSIIVIFLGVVLLKFF